MQALRFFYADGEDEAARRTRQNLQQYVRSTVLLFFFFFFKCEGRHTHKHWDSLFNVSLGRRV